MSLERRMWEAAGLLADPVAADAVRAAARRLERRHPVEVVVADHLGPCGEECGGVVRAGDECSVCLEECGVVVHDGCCLWAGTGPHGDAFRAGTADR
jgi:hypothetical protein